MRIAIFTPFFSAGNEMDSGIGIHYRDLAIGLKLRGNDVEVFHLPYDLTTSRSWFFQGIPIHSIGLNNPKIPYFMGIGKLCKLFKFFHFFEASQLFSKPKRKFQNLNRAKPFDVIEASSNRGVAYGVSTLVERPPIFTRVSTLMNQAFNSEDCVAGLNHKIAAWFEKKQIHKSEFRVTHTQSHASLVTDLIHLKQNDFSIIPHGITNSKFVSKDYPKPKSSKILKVLFVGKSEYRKGFDTLITSIPQIIKEFPLIQFDICGTGEMNEKAESDFHRLGLQNVFFHGYKSRSSLELFYSECDIFVAPSRYESFGIIYLEAMRHSKPIIACNTGGTPEVVSHGKSGLLIDPGNPSQLTKAIIDLAKNKALRKSMGINGKDRIKKKFSMEKLLDVTFMHYKKISLN